MVVTMPFSRSAFAFLRGLKAHNNKPWFEAHRDDYERELREPMRMLVGEMDARFKRFAPEMTGDLKRSMFRINRDIRFSRDKSPYKTNAGCWFFHRGTTGKVGHDGEGGSAGFYFHFEPGQCFIGGGLWMPPRPMLNKIRDAIADNPRGFDKVAKGLKKYGGLDDEHKLKRIPRGFDENHPAAEYLKNQSYIAGRTLKDSVVLGAGLPATLEREFSGLLPLVRWLNKAIGVR